MISNRITNETFYPCYNRSMTTDKQDNGDKHRANTSGLRPPWKPGQSGNPKGRPRKDACITSLVKELLEQDAGKGKTHAQLIAMAILKESAKGNISAIRELLDRIEGKVVDKHKIEGDVPVTLIREAVGGRKDGVQEQG